MSTNIAETETKEETTVEHKKPLTRYLLIRTLWVASTIDAIKESGGEIFAVNCHPGTPIGEAPKTREIWFYSVVDETDILRMAGFSEDDIKLANESRVEWKGTRGGSCGKVRRVESESIESLFEK